MKIKNCLLMILLSIFMIFAFSPIASAHGAEEPEVKTETQVKEDIIDKQIEKNEETTEKKEKAEPENEATPRALTETNSSIKETETKKEEEKESKITQKSDTAVVKPEKSQTKEEILEETEEPKEKSSSYTVEFTHKDLQYVLPGGTSVKLAKILDKLEIKGNKITEVECSDNNLFSATNESGEWVVNSHKAFHTDEHLYVTIDGTKYNIKVTDYSLPNNRWKWYDSACTIAVTKDRLDDNSGNVQTIYGYYYYQTRTLVIEGSGVIKDYSKKGSPMWNMCGDINLSTGNYVEHIEMGDGITTIGKNFFWAVNRSESNSSQKKEFTVHLPTSLQTIGPYAFQHSGAYIVYIPDSVTTIGQGAFDNCPQLSKVLIPNSVTTISSGAFSNTKNGCEFFVGATLGNLSSACGGNVSTRFGNHANQYFHWHGQKIGNTMYAFAKTTSEPTGHPGNNSTTVGNAARTQLVIIGYGAMNNFTYNATNPSPIRNAANAVNVTFDITFGSTANIPDTYKRGFTSIGQYAFFGLEKIQSIELPMDVGTGSNQKLTSIGKGAFEGCKELTHINVPGQSNNSFPENITTLEESVLSGCTLLGSFNIKSTVETIGVNAFRNDISIQSIIIPTSVTTIGNYAFAGCNGLKSIKPSDASTASDPNTLPNTITTINEGTFFGCTFIESFIIPNSVTSIKTKAFQGCARLTSVTIPTTIISAGLGTDAFVGLAYRADIRYNGKENEFTGKCTTSVVNVFGYDIDSTTDISYVYHFKCGNNLEYAVDGYNHTTTITGSGTMYDYTTTSTTPFKNHTNITNIDMQAGTSIGTYAFYQCTSITTVTLPSSGLTSVGQGAFRECEYLTSIKPSNASGSSDPNTFTNGLTRMCRDTFWLCERLTSFTIPSSVTTIEAGTFGKSGLTSINIPTTVTTIENPSQDNNTWGAFAQCSDLATITFASGRTANLTIGQGAFYGAKATSVTIPDKVTTIGKGAFQNCSYLATVNFEGTSSGSTYSNSITSVGQNAFENLPSNANIWYRYGNKASFMAKSYGGTLDGSFGSGNTYTYHFVIGEGQCGPTLYWDVTQTYQYVDGTNDIDETQMTISGSGDFYDGANSGDIIYGDSNRPWATYSNDVTCLTIKSGVTNIGHDAFQGFTNLSSVTFESPQTVTAIQYDAFNGCTNLTSITLPSTLTSIGHSAFVSTGLTSITIPSSVTNLGVITKRNIIHNTDGTYSDYSDDDSDKKIGPFYNCDSLASVTFEASPSVTYIGIGCFRSCDALTGITIPPTVTKIYENAFMYCTELIGDTPTANQLTIPASVTQINNSAFRQCEKLKSVVFSSGSQLTSIGDYAFQACKGSNFNVANLPEGLESVGTLAFQQCINLTTVTIPSTVKTINKQAFANCKITSLTFTGGGTSSLSIGQQAFDRSIKTSNISLTLPERTTSIGKSCFYQCSKLVSITFPSSLETIGETAFSGCSTLSEVNFEGTVSGSTYSNNITSIGQNAFANLPANADIWYRYGSKASLVAKSYGGTLDGSFGSGNTYTYHFVIGEGQCGPALYWDVTQTYQYVDGTNDIDETAMNVTGSGDFYTTYTNTNRPWINNKNASGTTANGEDNEIATVNIDSGATNIGANVFRSLHALQSITIPNTVLTINEYAFYLCENLNGVILQEGLTEIKYCAFRECTSLTSINIPKSLTSITGTNNNNISMGAFASCTGLTSITFDNNRTQNLIIGAGAFYNTRATSITLPEKLTVIGPGAFQYNTNLTTINIPSTVTTIDTNAFYLDAALTSITIPSSVTTIGASAFQSCSSLTSITIPTSISTAGLGAQAFSYIGGDASVTQVDIYYSGKQAQFEPKCTTSVTNVFGCDVVNNGKYAFHFTQDITYIGTDGSTLSGLSPTLYTTANSQTINLPIPESSGSLLDGWCINDSARQTDPVFSFTAEKSGPYGDLILYAKEYVREDVDYWAGHAEVLDTNDNPPYKNYGIIRPWITEIGEAGQETWYVLKDDVEFSDRLVVKGNVHLILKDGCTLTAKKGISVNSVTNVEGTDYPNSITIYAQDSDHNYINQNIGNITRMNLVEILDVYDSGSATYGATDSSEGPIFDLSTGKRYEKNTSAQGAAYRTEDETATIIIGADEWIEESPDVRYYTPDEGITKYYEYEDEDENSYIATSDQGGATRYYYYSDYVTAWDNTNAPNDRAWTLDEDWHNGDGSYFDTIGSKLYYWDHDEKGEFYYEVTDIQRTHKYYELENSHKYFTDDIDTYNDAKIAGKIITDSGNTSGAGIGGDAQHINGNITIYGGKFDIYGRNNNAGIGTGEFSSGQNANNNTITINGGTFDIKIYDLPNDEIGGGSPIGGGSYANGGNIVINGGRLTLESGSSSNSIGAGHGITNNTTTISLSWTNITDYITIKKNNINYAANGLTIDSNKPFVFVGEDIIADDSYATPGAAPAGTIAAKGNNEFTIIPYPNTSYVLTIPNRIVLPFRTLIYPFNPSVSVYTRPDDAGTPSVDESTPLVKPYQIALNIDKTNFVKDGDATKTIVYDLVDKEQGGTSLVGENKYEYFSSDSYDYDHYRETQLGGTQDLWISLNSNVWENLSPGIYRATVTFNVGLATNGTGLI